MKAKTEKTGCMVIWSIAGFVGLAGLFDFLGY
jgi:hypothetical protein